MGGSQSSLESYIKLHGQDSLIKLVLLKKKVHWLQYTCTRQINRRIDDQVKYVLCRMDQLIKFKKESILSLYAKAKSEILLNECHRVKNCEQKHGKTLQNVYGKNHSLDKLNLLKINFHVQTHIIKKRVKRLIAEQISAIQTQIFLRSTNPCLSKNDFEGLFKDQRKNLEIYEKDSEVQMKFEEFRKQVASKLGFDEFFWPYFDSEVRKAQHEVTKVQNEVQKNTKSMKKDLQTNWNIFKFQST